MKKVPCVEFYRSLVPPLILRDDPPSMSMRMKYTEAFSWRLRAKNGQPILTPHETFISHRNAVASFKRVADAMDARGPWQIKDLEGVTGSHAMLTAT